MIFTLLGTGSSSLVPVYNCQCIACERARLQPEYKRRPCSALIEMPVGKWLLDSGLTDLTERFAPEELKGIFQTHYHADHAQGLLHLRWGKDLTIPVYGPADPEGLADLYKHPGILDFSPTFDAFETKAFPGFYMTALPMEHSKLTYGYLVSTAQGNNLAYLTDTKGLSGEVTQFLRSVALDYAVIDCSYPPIANPKNHNDLTLALECLDTIGARKSYLTHIDHKVDVFLMQNPSALPDNVQAARDGLSLTLG